MKKSIAIFLAPLLFFTSFLPFLQTPLAPQKAYAEENCIYYVYDGQGNVRFLTNNTGGKITSLEYDPFGNFRSALGTGTNYLYQGQQKDAESSLYYLRARYYDPLLGRFISKDPVRGSLMNPQTQNPYAYAGNNPINRSDPSGKFWDYIPDAVFIGMDIANCDWGAAVVDTALGVIPGVPAVFGVTKRVGQAANAVDKANGAIYTGVIYAPTTQISGGFSNTTLNGGLYSKTVSFDSGTSLTAKQAAGFPVTTYNLPL